MSLRIASWNVLADSYMRPEWYPFSPPEVRDRAHRHPLLVDRVAALGADLICLQEVEPVVFRAIERRLEPVGYSGHYTRKGRDKPDGCATFSFLPATWREHHYRDGSGHLVLVAELEHEGRPVAVANTHLRWAPPDAPDHVGRGQARELLGLRADLQSWVVCGDLNAKPESELIGLFLSAGLQDAYASAPSPTCNANQATKRLDYILHTPDLCAEPVPVAPIEATTPLPSDTEPSDHLPVQAALRWV